MSDDDNGRDDLSVSAIIVGAIGLTIAVIVLILVIVIYCTTCLSVSSIKTNSIKSNNWQIDILGNIGTAGAITSKSNVLAANVTATGDLITATGLLLPSTGGVANTLLSSYQEFIFPSIWTDGTHPTAILSGSAINIGNSVILKLPNISGSFVGTISNSTALPPT